MDRESKKYWGAAPGTPGSHTKPRVAKRSSVCRKKKRESGKGLWAISLLMAFFKSTWPARLVDLSLYLIGIIWQIVRDYDKGFLSYHTSEHSIDIEQLASTVLFFYVSLIWM